MEPSRSARPHQRAMSSVTTALNSITVLGGLCLMCFLATGKESEKNKPVEGDSSDLELGNEKSRAEKDEAAKAGGNIQNQPRPALWQKFFKAPTWLPIFGTAFTILSVIKAIDYLMPRKGQSATRCPTNRDNIVELFSLLMTTFAAVVIRIYLGSATNSLSWMQCFFRIFETIFVPFTPFFHLAGSIHQDLRTSYEDPPPLIWRILSICNVRTWGPGFRSLESPKVVPMWIGHINDKHLNITSKPKSTLYWLNCGTCTINSVFFMFNCVVALINPRTMSAMESTRILISICMLPSLIQCCIVVILNKEVTLQIPVEEPCTDYLCQVQECIAHKTDRKIATQARSFKVWGIELAGNTRWVTHASVAGYLQLNLRSTNKTRTFLFLDVALTLFGIVTYVRFITYVVVLSQTMKEDFSDKGTQATNNVTDDESSKLLSGEKKTLEVENEKNISEEKEYDTLVARQNGSEPNTNENDTVDEASTPPKKGNYWFLTTLFFIFGLLAIAFSLMGLVMQIGCMTLPLLISVEQIWTQLAQGGNCAQNTV